MTPTHQPWFRGFVFLLFFAALGVLGYYFVIATPGDKPSSAAHARPVQTQAHVFGISGSALLAMPEDKQLSALRDLKSIGVTLVRFDIDWNGIQPNDPNHYTWSRYDRMMRSLHTVDMQGLGILDYTPPWARPAACSDSDKCAPDPQTFATFAATVVKRYEPLGLHNWEIWNEPNQTQFWKPVPNVAQYTALLKAVSATIRTYDPEAMVITGGLGGGTTEPTDITPTAFLTGIYQQGGAGSFRAVGLHPYTTPNLASVHPGGWNNFQQMHQIMVAHQDGNKQIWMTEYGAPTAGTGRQAVDGALGQPSGTDHVTEQLQAELVTDAVQTFDANSWAGPFVWYNYVDSGNDPTNRATSYGLRRFDGSAKPVYDAFKKVITAVNN